MTTPDDIPDGTECFRVGDDSERLHNLLAVLHRDGGHHVAAVGVEQACVDATRIFYDGLDAAERTRNELTRVTRERDELRAIVEGCTEPPTDKEIESHHATGGLWRCVVGDDYACMSRDGLRGVGAKVHRETLTALECSDVRWWSLDARRRPCARPVVAASTETEATRMVKNGGNHP